MIVITIKRYNNKLLSIVEDGTPLYQGGPTDYVIVFNEEVPPDGTDSTEPEEKK